MLVSLLVAQVLATSDPLAVSLVTEDIPRFWKVFDEAKDEDLVARLQRDYLDKGSPGLRFFNFTKINGAEKLAASIRQNRAAYEQARSRTLRIAEAAPAIRAACCAFKYLYPEAKFPPVTFVIGRFSSGGTANMAGLMLGAEMEGNDPAKAHYIVAHELVHFNQKMPKKGLRDDTIAEGSADFIGELVSGGMINVEQHAYGNAHEAELWKQWSAAVADGDKIADWIGTSRQRIPRLGDLGYYVGYRITQAYYDKATDKRQAIREILERQDGARFIVDSGYNP